MAEYLVHINPIDGEQAKSIVIDLEEQGSIPKGSHVYVGPDSSVAVTRPPTARVEQIVETVDGVVSTIRITS